jgi:dTDP-4-amino-4,6-dideoxygalactose transaminase
MNDIQATLGLSQLTRLDKNVRRRHEIAKFYDIELKNLQLITPWQAPNIQSSYHLYPILIKFNSDFKSQKQVYNELIENNIGVNIHYIPVHRHPYYEKLGFKKNDFPIAEKFYKEVISIPLFPTLQDSHQKYVVETLKKVMNA